MASRRAKIGRSGSYLNAIGGVTRRSAASLATLDGLPKILLSGKVQFAEYLAALDRQGLHGAEAPLEFCVRCAQRRLGIDIELSRQIRGGKQQIANFLEN